MRDHSWAGAILGVVLFGALLSAEPTQRCQPSDLPSNIVMPDMLQRALQKIYDRSPTFRAQCERLARAPDLRVTVRLNNAIPSGCRAFTIIRRQGNEIRAEVHLPPGRGLVELAAHEFEHLIEQVEGLNLRSLARTRGTGVYEVYREAFESDRAIRAGRVVLGEIWRGSESPAAD